MREQLIEAYRNAEIAINALDCAMQALSNAATTAYGEELRADACGGDEIEFRRFVDGYPNDNDCLRIEDILAKLEE